MAGKGLVTKENAVEQLDNHGTEVLGGVAKVIDMATDTDAAGLTADVVAMLQDAYKAREIRTIGGKPLVDNPLFRSHGIDGDSPRTVKYLRTRMIKRVGGSALSLGGAIGAAAGSEVNVGGIVRHGATEADTLMHIARLKMLGRGFKQSEWLTAHLDTLVYIKTFKAGVRGAQLVGDAIPAKGAGSFVSGAIGIGAAGAKVIGSSLLDRVVVQVATQLHWRAYQEITIGGAGGGHGVGPAYRMLDELFTRRVHRVLGGGYDTAGFIREPAGWLAVQDKLKLI